MLEEYVRQRLRQREILLMTHIVIGHPNFDTSLRSVSYTHLTLPTNREV